MKSDETAAKPLLGMHTRAFVGPAALLVNGRDVDRQLPVASAPSRLGALDPGVIAGTRNLASLSLPPDAMTRWPLTLGFLLSARFILDGLVADLKEGPAG